MKSSKSSDQQVAFILRQAEEGTRGDLSDKRLLPDKITVSAVPEGPLDHTKTFLLKPKYGGDAAVD